MAAHTFLGGTKIRTLRGTSSKLPLSHPVPQFGVSVPEKLLTIVATRGEIFSLKFTKYRLAAGLLPDLLGSLSAPPDPLATIMGA